MNEHDDSGPRPARGPAGQWVPRHADPVAAARLWRLTPLERADVFRRASLELIARSTDPDVRGLARLMHDAIAAREPERIIRDAGLVIAGGAHSLKEQEDIRWRDAKLRGLLRQSPYSGLTMRSAARAVLHDFRRYETRAWPRDRASGVLPQAGPSAVFAEILSRGVYMPKTINGLIVVFRRETSSPL